MFQAQDDIGHGIHTAIHSLGTNELDFEPVAVQQSAERVPREIMQMRGRMDLTPFASSDPGQPTAQITGCQRQESFPGE